jgi:hypothetical protein
MKLIKPNNIVVLLTICLSSCMKGKKVDQIFHNASIYCFDENNSTGEAMAIKNGVIIEIGPERQILNKYRSSETINVEGKELVPSFTNCNLHLDSLKKWDFTLLEEIELNQLEQGISEVFVHEVTNQQLIQLRNFTPKMSLVWNIYLKPTNDNIEYVRKSNKKNKNLNILGFTIANENESIILQACSIAKNKLLQIEVNFMEGQKNIPTIINSLQNYKLDHRWSVFNIQDKKITTLYLLEENNFLFCLNERSKISLPIYLFGTNNTSEKLIEKLNNFSEVNKIDFFNSLKSITNWSSYLSFSENSKGSLVKGKNANFTLLTSSLKNNKEKNTIYSKATYRKGKLIYTME